MSLPADAELAFPPASGWGREWWLRACMVSTLDGSVVDAQGRSRGISSPADRDVFLRMRRACDVILVGAGTVRAEDYARTSVPIAVLSRSLDLPDSLRLFAPAAKEPRPLLLTTRTAIEQAPQWLTRRAELVDTGDTRVDMTLALQELAQRDLTRIHCEGGPSTLGALATANLVDEVFLTITPELLGTPTRLLTTASAPHAWRTTGLWTHEGTTVMRVQRAHP